MCVYAHMRSSLGVRLRNRTGLTATDAAAAMCGMLCAHHHADIDECRAEAAMATNGTICAAGLVCRNTIGSYRCECATGYEQDKQQQQQQSTGNRVGGEGDEGDEEDDDDHGSHQQREPRCTGKLVDTIFQHGRSGTTLRCRGQRVCAVNIFRLCVRVCVPVYVYACSGVRDRSRGSESAEPSYVTSTRQPQPSRLQAREKRDARRLHEWLAGKQRPYVSGRRACACARVQAFAIDRSRSRARTRVTHAHTLRSF